MFRLHKTLKSNPVGLVTSSLYDQTNFYDKFASDLARCRNEVVIESPFITTKRMLKLMPTFKTLLSRGVRITINTKDPNENTDCQLAQQSQEALWWLGEAGVQVLFTTGHHRKLALLDRTVVWEGSLNILSQNNSCEIMRRIESTDLAEQLVKFIRLDHFLS